MKNAHKTIYEKLWTKNRKTGFIPKIPLKEVAEFLDGIEGAKNMSDYPCLAVFLNVYYDRQQKGLSQYVIG